MVLVDANRAVQRAAAIRDDEIALRSGSQRRRRIMVLAISAALLLCARDGHAGVATVVGSLPSPLPAPRFDLAFDSTTGTLWGIENATASANVMNFTLDGSFVSGFLTASSFNNMGIAVNQVAGESKRIFYWQNLASLIREVDANGAPVGSTSLPFGYHILIAAIGFDPAEGRIVAPHGGLGSVDPTIEAGFSHIAPGVGVESTEPFDFSSQLGTTLFLGFELSRESYWVLGPVGSADEIVQIDRASLTVVDHFVLPESSGQTYRGLARDPSTGIFYSNFNDAEIRALTLPEPGAPAGGVALAALLLWRAVAPQARLQRPAREA